MTMEHLDRKDNILMKAIIKRDWEELTRICGDKTLRYLINTIDKDGLTPVLFALSPHNAPEGVILQLIEHSSPQCLETIYRTMPNTILHTVVYHGYKLAVKRVLELTNRTINIINWRGYTPLHNCLEMQKSYEDQRDMAVCLVTYGASCTIKNQTGKTPIDYYKDNKCEQYEETTRTQKKEELIKLLEELSVPAEILARGDEAVGAFKEDLKKGKMEVTCSRMMFLGKEGVGKTSCLKAMLGKKLDEEEPATNGIVMSTLICIDGDDLWQEQRDLDECKLTEEKRDGAYADILIEELEKLKIQPSTTSSSAAFGDGRNPHRSLSSSTTRSPHMSATAMEETRSTQEVISAPTNQGMSYGIRQKVVEKLSNKNCDSPIVRVVWDYAGHFKYYPAHRFFLTDGAAYSVVFSLLDNLHDKARPRKDPDPKKGPFEMTNLQMNVFWIRSIYEYAVHDGKNKTWINGKIASPPISLVGTHMDKLTGTDEENEKLIKNTYNELFAEIKNTPYEAHVDREMYVLDNNNPKNEGIQKLKKNTFGNMRAMKRIVPICWVDFQSKIQKVGKTRLYMSMQEVRQIAVTSGVATENVTHVLNYLYDMGIILYSSTNEKLKNIVVTNIQMLMEICTNIISDDHNETPRMMEYFNKLNDNGLLEEKLLRYFLMDKLTGRKDGDDVMEVVLELMKTFGLLYEMNQPSDGNRLFVVPSRIKPTDTDPDPLKVKKDDDHTVSIYLTPDDDTFLPDSVYDILVVRFVNLSKVKRYPKLFHNQANIGYDDEHYVRLGRVTIDKKNSVKVEISRIMEHSINKSAQKPDPEICMEIVDILNHPNDTYPSRGSVGYVLQVICPVCTSTTIPDKPHLQVLAHCLKETNVFVFCDKDDKKVSADYVRVLFVAETHSASSAALLLSPNAPSFIRTIRSLTEGYKAIPSPKLPFEVMSDICFCLDTPRPIPSQDWRGLAGKLGYDRYVDFLSRMPTDSSPTMCMINGWHEKDWSVKYLKECLVDMNRHDVIQVIDQYLDTI